MTRPAATRRAQSLPRCHLSPAVGAAVGVFSQPPAMNDGASGNEGKPTTTDALRWCDLRVLAGGIIAGLGFGIGTSFGLFVEPITTALGLGREIISLAVGISMGVNGFSSIFWGNVNDRLGIFPTVAIGASLLTVGLWLTSFARSSGLLLFSIPLSGFGDGSITPGIILGAVGKLFKEDAVRARAMGRTQALQSCGAVFVPPLIQAVIAAVEYWYTAFRVVGCVAILMIPLAWSLRPKDTPSEADGGGETTQQATASMRETVAAGLRSRSFVLTTVGFFACGFHVVFLTTHLAAHCKDKGLEDWVGGAALSCIGVGNIAGGFAAGWAGGKWPKKKHWVLAAIYFSRSVLFLLFDLLPISPALVLIFSTLMGVLYLSTVPLTVGIVMDVCGDRWGTTMFGFAFASHQLGAFFGSWLGGRIFDNTGSYSTMWLLMALVGLASAVIHLPIDPKPLELSGRSSDDTKGTSTSGKKGAGAPVVVATAAGSTVATTPEDRTLAAAAAGDSGQAGGQDVQP